MSEATNSDNAALQPAARAIIALNSTQTELDIAAFIEEAKSITEVTDKASRERAHKSAMRLQKARTTIEKTGKAAREDAQAFVREVLAEEKRLKGLMSSEEDRIFKLRDDFDTEQRRIEEERAAAEAARIAEIKGKIEGLRNLPLALAGEPSAAVLAELQALEDFQPVEAAFAEFTEECARVRHEVMGSLRELAQRVRAQEDSAAAALEAKRVADEALAAERAAIEAERAALAREREELAAARAAIAAAQVVEQKPEPEQTSEPAPVEATPITEVVAEPEFTIHDKADELPVEMIAPATAPDIRMYAIFTAGQLDCLAEKAQLCGATDFAAQLKEAANTLRDGTFDGALSGANIKHLVVLDNRLIDHTMNAIDAIGAI
jgi:hypothetical protein